VETIERVEILTQLRSGEFDVLVGINLLREGIDLPEVSFIAILDADKIGFNAPPRAYPDNRQGGEKRRRPGCYVRGPGKRCHEDRPGGNQPEKGGSELAYNEEHGITPMTIKKSVHDILERHKEERIDATLDELNMLKKTHNLLVPEQRKSLVKALEQRMLEHAKNLEFEEAATLRDEIARIKEGGDV
jgi:excinuclease ABC subunit B